MFVKVFLVLHFSCKKQIVNKNTCKFSPETFWVAVVTPVSLSYHMCLLSLILIIVTTAARLCFSLPLLNLHWGRCPQCQTIMSEGRIAAEEFVDQCKNGTVHCQHIKLTTDQLLLLGCCFTVVTSDTTGHKQWAQTDREKERVRVRKQQLRVLPERSVLV